MLVEIGMRSCSQRDSPAHLGYNKPRKAAPSVRHTHDIHALTSKSLKDSRSEQGRRNARSILETCHSPLRREPVNRPELLIRATRVSAAGSLIEDRAGRRSRCMPKVMLGFRNRTASSRSPRGERKEKSAQSKIAATRCERRGSGQVAGGANGRAPLARQGVPRHSAWLAGSWRRADWANRCPPQSACMPALSRPNRRLPPVAQCRRGPCTRLGALYRCAAADVRTSIFFFSFLARLDFITVPKCALEAGTERDVAENREAIEIGNDQGT